MINTVEIFQKKKFKKITILWKNRFFNYNLQSINPKIPKTCTYSLLISAQKIAVADSRCVSWNRRCPPSIFGFSISHEKSNCAWKILFDVPMCSWRSAEYSPKRIFLLSAPLRKPRATWWSEKSRFFFRFPPEKSGDGWIRWSSSRRSPWHQKMGGSPL